MKERIRAFGQCMKATVSYVILACAAFDNTKLAAECSVTKLNGAKVRGAAALIRGVVLNASLYTALEWTLAGGFSLSIDAFDVISLC